EGGCSVSCRRRRWPSPIWGGMNRRDKWCQFIFLWPCQWLGLDLAPRLAAGHVADLEVEQFLRRLQLPLVLRLALGWADVHQQLQRVLHDGFSQLTGRVVRAAGSTVGLRREEDAPLGNDDGIAEDVGPNQACEQH